MSSTNRTPGQADEPTAPGEGHEQIDPTRTFDAYFDQQDAPEATPGETGSGPSAESEYPESETTQNRSGEKELDASESTESQLTETSSDHDEFTESPFIGSGFNEPGQVGAEYSEASHSSADQSGTEQIRADYTSSDYTSSDYSGTDYSSTDDSGANYAGTDYTGTGYDTGGHLSRPATETVAPAGFSAPTMVAPVTRTDYGSTESTETGPRTARMRTVVLGLVLLVIAGAVLVGQLTTITVNASAVVLALMIGAGLLLIVGARRS
jgi:hypothetical protein